MTFPVPGLARGIEILRLLEVASPLTLEEIAHRTGFPKASVFRLMETLTDLDLVGRDPATKSYTPLACLTGVSLADTSFDTLLDNSLDNLAQQSGQTAEWYLPINEGLVMVQRSEPPRSELQVRARIGFVRTWDEELDAVACVGRAWSEHPPKVLSKLWTYGENGKRVTLSTVEVRRRQTRARSRGFSTDLFYNTNGVKRMAAVVLEGPHMRGVLALAQCFTPKAASQECSSREKLIETAARLNQNNPFTFNMGDLD